MTRSDSLTAVQAAEMLGVRRETLYAYVSRGLLVPQRSSGPTGGRRSHFDRRQVERLAARHRRGGRAGSLEVQLDTELTLLDATGHLYYRGHDVRTLAATRTPEQVAELLWDAAPGQWQLPEPDRQVLNSALAALPVNAEPLDRVVVALVALASLDPDRFARDPLHLHVVGRRSMLAAAMALPRRQELAGHPSLAELVWSFASDRAADPAELQAMSAALVLLADHELAASTFAARVAASTWCDPYVAVVAGLSAVNGALHGRAGLGALALLQQAERAGIRTAMAALPPEAVPGFGHRIYAAADPRSDTLLDLLPVLDRSRWQVVESTMEGVSRATGLEPNVDFALAALTFLAELRADTSLAVFAVARTAGLVGHISEEYRHRLRFRPRAVYVGREPRDSGPA